MEEGGGRRRRPSLLEQMAAVDRGRDLAGLTLEDVTVAQKPPANAVAQKPLNRTLLDVIRDEERNGGSLFGHKDKKTWKAFRDKLRLMRAGAAWTSTVPIPASDVPIQSYNNGNSSNFNGRSRSLMSRRTSMRFDTVSAVNAGDSSEENSAVSGSRPQMTRRESSRYGLSENALYDSSRPDISSVDTNVVGDEPPARSLRPQMTRRESSRYGLSENAPSDSSRPDNSSVDANAVGDEPPARSFRPQMTRRESSRYGLSDDAPSDSSRPDNSFVDTIAVGDEPPARSFRPQMSRRTSTRHTGIPAIENDEEQIPESRAALPEERSLSAREAVAAQEAAEAAAAEQQSSEEPDSTGAEPVRMSLMDLLEETDRQMGVVGSRYAVADEINGCDEEEEEDDGVDGGDGIENTCCVCMVRHKGAAFIPCGHTFCRLCSRELWVQRGNCPLCNEYISEILDIF